MEKKGQGVEYVPVADHYFEKRGLRRYAGVWSLWALGVGAVISGDFFGWNFGLAAGGFGGLLIATVVITVMYAGLCFSIAEMAAALPHTGGAYSFARSAMGPWGAYITGLAENMEYILTPAVIVVGIGGYLGAIFGTPESVEPLWWLAAYAAFVGLNVAGVETTFRFTVLITVLALGVLVVFWISAIPHFDMQWALNIEPETGQSRWLPHGAAGLLTLVVAAFLTLFLNAGIQPGSQVLGASAEPLFEGFKTIFGAGLGAKLLALVAVTGLIASFHSIIFAYGRQIFSLSRAGYFPRWLSRTHHRRQTPHVALFVGALLGYVVAYGIHSLGPEHPVGAVLLNMAVFGAVIAYALQMVSYILLRIRLPHIDRPYRSPLGVPGAVVALLIAVVTLVALFVTDPIYQRVVAGAAVWYGLGLLWFAFYARHRLVLSPEESFALSAHSSQDDP